MKMTVSKPLRCAIYTRKSTEHNLDLAFNSLDAQREACEAYVKSQAHEGWRLLPDRYDDGGLSGASLERPALQQLLTEVREGRVEVVVVYKVDRLTRSLADFAKLVEIFDAHGVSFASITQSFNTTSSMGRLTLNVLLSFAQFEREVIGERVRDKIAASKRKGIWVGGPVPLGYRSVSKKLEIVAEEAEKVRIIFERYLVLGAIGLLAQDLAMRGVTPRDRKHGEHNGATPQRFMVGPLAHILKNRFYVGDVVYRGEVHVGAHEPIIGRALFDAVQARLRDRAVTRKLRLSSSPSFLFGLLFDDRGNHMSPSHANKRGVRYRYYVSQALLQNRKAEAGTISRVAAPDVEELILAAVRHHITAAAHESASPGSTHLVSELSPRQLIALKVERIVLRARCIQVTLREGSVTSTAPEFSGNSRDALAAIVDDKAPKLGEWQTINIPWNPTAAKARKGVSWTPSTGTNLDAADRDTLLASIARSRSWMSDLMAGRIGSFEEIAERENKVVRHVRRLLPLAFLSPRVVNAIADGSAPAHLTVTLLTGSLPYRWAEQEKTLGIISA